MRADLYGDESRSEKSEGYENARLTRDLKCVCSNSGLRQISGSTQGAMSECFAIRLI